MATTLPYGSWPSPISAELLATGGTRLGGPVQVGQEVWWTEGIATEGGRQAIVRTAGPIGADGDGDATPVTVLPAPFNARSRVHEYGGSSWTTLPQRDGRPLVVFVDFASQRVHAFVEGEEPRPLSPVGPEVASAGGPSLRYADPQVVTLPGGATEVWWVVEDHTGESIERYIGAIPLDGSAAEDASAIRRVTPASRFVAHARVSPDGTRLAWLSWEHPQMPWDGTLLHVAPLVGGSAGAGEVVAGSTTESVLQPEWLDAQRLVFLSDASGWWNPWLWDGSGTRRLCDRAEEFAGPMWMLGTTWYTVLDPDRLLVAHGHADDALGVLTLSTGEILDLDLGLTSISGVSLRGDGLLTVLGSSPTAFPAILAARLDVSGPAPALGGTRVLRSSREDAPDPGVLPVPEPITVALEDGGVVHAIVFRPRHEGICGPEGERPPFIARVHGGPTSHVPPVLNLAAAYYTSRGIGVVEVNYGGSTGYGRAYRDRLKGQWGVVDVADTVAVMEHLVAGGLADGARLGIEGGSAGGWTTLACLTRTDTFSAGASSFGVAELETFISDTHDFESRYIDGLVGPYPERKDLYVERAPLSHVDELACPVLLLQGDEDRIVPPSQSEMFRDALAAKGIPHAYLLFEGEQHGFRQASSIIRATEASLSFYGQVFGFSPLGVPVLQLES
ncbi:dipeptidyl-peptidase 5 [Brachybacterium hainanense]|uniref:Prolyl oligopeptidase family serine peptidase n=1 Tax=Brachybacterium hainanense TaxID=1541174 RepID=A0ABV6R9X1_9MICO